MNRSLLQAWIFSVVAGLVLGVATFLSGFIWMKTFEEKCLSEESFLSFVPEHIVNWKTTSIPGKGTHVYLPTAQETLFMSIQNLSKASILRTVNNGAPKVLVHTNPFLFHDLFPPSFTILPDEEETACFNFGANESKVACYSPHDHNVSFVPQVYQAIDPMLWEEKDDTIWFRGKGTRGSSALNSPYAYYVYRYNVKTHEVSLHGMSTCTPQDRDRNPTIAAWCAIPALHNDGFFDLSSQIQEWTQRRDRCEMLPYLIAATVLIITTNTAPLMCIRFVPEVWIVLNYIGSTIVWWICEELVITGGNQDRRNDRQMCWWFLFSGIFLVVLGVGLRSVRRSAENNDDGLFSHHYWSGAFIRVGSIVGAAGWIDHPDFDDYWILSITVLLIPLFVLYRRTRQQVCLACMMVILFHFVHEIRGGSEVLLVSAFFLLPLAKMTNKKMLWRAGLFAWFLGVCSLDFTKDDISVDDCVLSIGVFLFVLISVVAIATNDSDAALVAALSLALVVCVSVYGFIEDILYDLDYMYLMLRYALKIGTFFVAMEMTRFMLPHVSNTVHQPREIWNWLVMILRHETLQRRSRENMTNESTVHEPSSPLPRTEETMGDQGGASESS